MDRPDWVRSMGADIDIKDGPRCGGGGGNPARWSDCGGGVGGGDGSCSRITRKARFLTCIEEASGMAASPECLCSQPAA